MLFYHIIGNFATEFCIIFKKIHLFVTICATAHNILYRAENSVLIAKTEFLYVFVIRKESRLVNTHHRRLEQSRAHKTVAKGNIVAVACIVNADFISLNGENAVPVNLSVREGLDYRRKFRIDTGDFILVSNKVGFLMYFKHFLTLPLHF